MKLEGSVQDGQVVEVLDKIMSLGGTTEQAMGSIARFMENEVALGFRQSRSPYGEAWDPLVARSGQPLIDTRTLLSSISSAYGSDFAEVGTNLEYAPIHQFGGYAGVGKQTYIPARPYLPIEGDEAVLPGYWEEEILGILEKTLEKTLNG